MSWASRRRASYLGGVTLFFVIVIGGPLVYWYLSIPKTCTDGKMNQGETAVDKGGPCPLLDERALQPYATLWVRAFRVRDGLYNAAAYVYNPNKEAGVRKAQYRLGLYDAQNILIAERIGTTFIMPGAATPVLESRIDTGNRIVAHTYFEFTNTLTWEPMTNAALPLAIQNKEISDISGTPRLSANVQNRAVDDVINPSFIAVIFDPAGNAFAASATTLERISAGGTSGIVFSWPDPFHARVGRIDIISLVAPTLSWQTSQ